jgi:hypothetical protein
MQLDQGAHNPWCSKRMACKQSGPVPSSMAKHLTRISPVELKDSIFCPGRAAAVSVSAALWDKPITTTADLDVGPVGA